MAENKTVWCVDCQFCPRDDPFGVCWFGERYFGSHPNLCGHFLGANLVRVVRCKECVNRSEDGEFCRLDSADPYDRSRRADDDNWFCADGERMADNGHE